MFEGNFHPSYFCLHSTLQCNKTITSIKSICKKYISPVRYSRFTTDPLVIFLKHILNIGTIKSNSPPLDSQQYGALRWHIYKFQCEKKKNLNPCPTGLAPLCQSRHFFYINILGLLCSSSCSFAAFSAMLQHSWMTTRHTLHRLVHMYFIIPAEDKATFRKGK